MGLIESIFENWFIIFPLLAITVLYFYKENRQLERTNKNDIETFIEVITWFMIISTFQNKLFPEHSYFLIGFVLFIPVWFGIISYIMKNHKQVLVESRIQGERYFKMGLLPEDVGEILVKNTGIRVHIMESEFYESLEHYGSQVSPFTKVGNKVTHCDFFDGKIVYHPENPFVHNILYWADNVMWRTLKNVIPKVQHVNMMLTELFNVNLHVKLDEMREKMPHVLLGTETQYSDKPFPVQATMQNEMERLMTETKSTLKEKESKPIKEGD